MPDQPRLPCEQIVYRTVTRAKDFGRDCLPLAGAFLRRQSDTDGMSVNYNVDVPDGCGVGLSKKKAVVSVHVGWLRDLDLDVEADTEDHAVITGVPFSNDVDQIETVEQLAAKMAEMARVEWIEPKFHNRLEQNSEC